MPELCYTICTLTFCILHNKRGEITNTKYNILTRVPISNTELIFITMFWSKDVNGNASNELIHYTF